MGEERINKYGLQDHIAIQSQCTCKAEDIFWCNRCQLPLTLKGLVDYVVCLVQQLQLQGTRHLHQGPPLLPTEQHFSGILQELEAISDIILTDVS